MDNTEDIDDMFGDNRSGCLEHFDIQCSFFNDAIEELRFYFKTVEDFMAEQAKKSGTEFTEKLNRLPKNKRDEFFEWNYPHYWETFFQEMWKETFILSLTSYFESYLTRIYGDLLSYKGIGEKKGKSTIDCIQKNIEKAIQADTSSCDWNTIEKLYKIRNVIAHNLGRCDDKGKDIYCLQDFIEETDGITIDEKQLLIETSFCWRSLKTIQDFWFKLSNIIREAITAS
ncbi:MAG: hypothetical protein FJ263_04120 [Planctomycetes bacterium]|nr:hypothetical protein [Planctomycetota bacterium]